MLLVIRPFYSTILAGVGIEEEAGEVFELASPTRSDLGNGGHPYAKRVLEGGSGNAIAGHGQYIYGTGNTVVPPGTSVTMARPGVRILDETGRFMEAGDWDGLRGDLSKLINNRSGEAVVGYLGDRQWELRVGSLY